MKGTEVIERRALPMYPKKRRVFIVCAISWGVQTPGAPRTTQLHASENSPVLTVVHVSLFV